MTTYNTFNIGDRVKRFGEPSDWDIGSVTDIGPEGYDVLFDSTGPYSGMRGEELELVSRPGEMEAKPATVTADPIHHPAHYYHPSGIEVIQITRHETFLRGNIVKYVLRAPYKGTELEDLRKARQYLDWEIERVENSERKAA